MSQSPALTHGVHHVGLTVSDLEETREFFTGALGFRLIGGDGDYPAAFLSDGVSVITLWQAEDPATATAFDRKRNVGLHHLALQVEDAAALNRAFAAAVAWPGVNAEFAPGPTRPGASARHALIRIPGGIRLELYAAPTD